ncbi:TraI domain-containing protein [Vibrio tritonius]|uniref:TraI domain-containing protein n=1 Tax=Vibrio tritonius TaxID=1435069 RepID=A0ABS7YPG2_9VIBR|nr:TraI domain-containing protein [Vibrio tritonius]MCA2016149.1 TraI domain-containing protein [Vibrio tritonius]
MWQIGKGFGLGKNKKSSQTNGTKMQSVSDSVLTGDRIEEFLVAKESGAFLYKTSDDLLRSTEVRLLVATIKELVGLDDKWWNRYYMPAICRFAEVCQGTPASEYYHHADSEGLFIHSLEVVVYSLRASYGVVYFPDRQTETISDIERVFIYSIFCAALLHDAGKLITDIRWSMRSGGEWAYWSPLFMSAPSESHLKIDRNKNSDGKNVYHKTSHQFASLCFLTDIIPAEGLFWIGSFSHKYCPELWLDFLHTVVSDYENGSEIGACVKAGDIQSTKDNKATLSLAPASGTGQYNSSLPLHVNAKAAIGKILLDPANFSLNVNGAFQGKYSHIERFGDLIFLSSNAVLKIISKELSGAAINIPNPQGIGSELADNAVTVMPVSGDTMWWARFVHFDPEKGVISESKELSYLVVLASDYPDISIPDVFALGGDIRFSAKSTQAIGPVITTDNDPQLFKLLYGDSIKVDKSQTTKLDTVVLNEDIVDKNATDALNVANSVSNLVDGEEIELQSTAQPEKSVVSTQVDSSVLGETDSEHLGAIVGETPVISQLPPLPSLDDPASDGDTPNVSDNVFAKLFATDLLKREIVTKPKTSEKRALPKESMTPASINKLSQRGKGEVLGIEPVRYSKHEFDMKMTLTGNDHLPEWLKPNLTRTKRAESASMGLVNRLFPFIERELEAKRMTFNRKDSPIHNTPYGLFIVAPLFFNLTKSTLDDKLRDSIKRSKFCLYANATLSIIAMKPKGRNEKVYGFLLNYPHIKVDGKHLPINEHLELCDVEEQVAGNLSIVDF